MHYKEVCRCGTTLTQCRCPSPGKSITVSDKPCTHGVSGTVSAQGIFGAAKPVRPEDQQLPLPNGLPSMHDKAATALMGRKALGAERYGVPLQPSNGRDAVRDAYEEALDGAAYGAQAVWEQEHPEATYVGVLLDALRQFMYIADDGQQIVRDLDFGPMFVPPAVVTLLESHGFRVLKEK